MEEEKDDLRKKFDPTVEDRYEKNFKWHHELMRKREVLVDNKQKIEELIRDLDLEKNRDIRNTVKEVDSNFGQIFSILLPGTNCRLEPVYDMQNGEVLTGL